MPETTKQGSVGCVQGKLKLKRGQSNSLGGRSIMFTEVLKQEPKSRWKQTFTSHNRAVSTLVGASKQHAGEAGVAGTPTLNDFHSPAYMTLI